MVFLHNGMRMDRRVEKELTRMGKKLISMKGGLLMVIKNGNIFVIKMEQEILQD